MCFFLRVGSCRRELSLSKERGFAYLFVYEIYVSIS